MSVTCFSSDSQELDSFLDNSEQQLLGTPPRKTRLLSDNDPPLFYSQEYEYSLLMEHFEVNFDANQEPWGANLLEDATDVVTLPSPGTAVPTIPMGDYYAQNIYQPKAVEFKPVHRISPYDYNKPSPSTVFEKYEEDEEEPQEQGAPRRGRPMKQTSNSKMANYARMYRETKKNQLTEANAEVQRLKQENKELKKDNDSLRASFKRIEREVDVLRRAVNQNMNGNITALISRMVAASGVSDEVGVCMHMVGGKLSVQVCDSCNDRNKPVKEEFEDPFADVATTPLFNGDFGSIEKYIH